MSRNYDNMGLTEEIQGIVLGGPSPMLKSYSPRNAKAKTLERQKAKRRSKDSAGDDMVDASRHSNRERSSSASECSFASSSEAECNEGSFKLRKKTNLDDVKHPRRRATIACEVCRSRKSRCDGVKPKCRLCSDLKVECVYREPGVKLDAGDKLILERLKRIESLLQPDPNKVADTLPVERIALQSNAIPPTRELANADSGSHLNERGITSNQAYKLPFSNTISTTPATMNIETATPANLFSNHSLNRELVRCSLIQSLLPQPYGTQQLLCSELDRDAMPTQPPTPMDIEPSGLAFYIEIFFERVNTWFAIIDPHMWENYYQAAFDQGFQSGIESCIVLAVLALGAANCASATLEVAQEHVQTSINFFTTAWRLLPQIIIGNGIPAIQSLLLSSLYLFYLGRPLDAWNLLSNIRAKLQLLFSLGDLEASSGGLEHCLLWNTILLENDLLWKLNVPHSGLQQYMDEVVPLSNVDGWSGGASAPSATDDLRYFRADASLRCLSSRASRVLHGYYARKDSLSGLQPTVEDLDHQLAVWASRLPVALQFPHHTIPQSDPNQTLLRQRYFACRALIFQPYVHAVLDDPHAITDPVVRQCCHAGLEASLRQLEHVHAHRASSPLHLWQDTLGLVHQCLLVMGATCCTELAALLPPPDAVNSIVGNVIHEVERFASRGPSLQLGAYILRGAEDRRLGLIEAMLNEA